MANKKLVCINDPDIWEFISAIPNFSAWVRDKARKEMKKQAGIDPELAEYIEVLLSRRLDGRVVDPVIVAAADMDKFDIDSSGFL